MTDDRKHAVEETRMVVRQGLDDCLFHSAGADLRRLFAREKGLSDLVGRMRAVGPEPMLSQRRDLILEAITQYPEWATHQPGATSPTWYGCGGITYWLDYLLSRDMRNPIESGRHWAHALASTVFARFTATDYLWLWYRSHTAAMHDDPQVDYWATYFRLIPTAQNNLFCRIVTHAMPLMSHFHRPNRERQGQWLEFLAKPPTRLASPLLLLAVLELPDCVPAELAVDMARLFVFRTGSNVRRSVSLKFLQFAWPRCTQRMNTRLLDFLLSHTPTIDADPDVDASSSDWRMFCSDAFLTPERCKAVQSQLAERGVNEHFYLTHGSPGDCAAMVNVLLRHSPRIGIVIVPRMHCDGYGDRPSWQTLHVSADLALAVNTQIYVLDPSPAAVSALDHWWATCIKPRQYTRHLLWFNAISESVALQEDLVRHHVMSYLLLDSVDQLCIFLTVPSSG